MAQQAVARLVEKAARNNPERFMSLSVRTTIPRILVLLASVLLTRTIQAQSHPSGNPGPNEQAAPDQAGHPDLNGVWAAPFVPDISKTLGHQPPFTPYGAERWKKVQEADDPLAQCLPIGPARGIQAGLMPFQLIQTPAVIGILFENQRTFRVIYTDGRPHPKDLDPTWFGDSIGTWEGHTLVVDTVGVTARTWIDTIGHEHSDQLHIIERFEPIDKNTIQWTVRYEDPVFFTQPWSIMLPIKRQDTVIMSYSCEENEKDRIHLRRDDAPRTSPGAAKDSE
jgi:hypothetical protein